MVFSSLAFLFVFMPIIFLLYCVCANDHLRNALLIISSLFFYAYGEPIAVFIMLISIFLNYLFGLMCSCSRFVRLTGLIAAVIVNIGLLFVFKYAHFFLVSFGIDDNMFNVALPIGISFFTFQGLSYVIDVYRDKSLVQKNPFLVMLYISFFPQLIAGPIVKYHDIKEQLRHREFNIDRIESGIQRFIWGLGKKVLIAGPMGLMADSIYSLSYSSIGAASAWIAAVSYMLQIYYDFSGYSDMAIGLGRIFGFDFAENFNKPYAAANMQHFWRRWHISLSTWFKEYVYIPLGGNRKGQARTYINKYIVFMLTGLWHGANWTFILWGILHGLALIIEDLVKRLFAKRESGKSQSAEVSQEAESSHASEASLEPTASHDSEIHDCVGRLLNVLGHVYTLLFVMLTFIVFRADNLSYAFGMIGRLFGTGGGNATAFSLLTPTYIMAFVAAVIFASRIPDMVIEKLHAPTLRILSVLVYVAGIVSLISGGYNPFIYFRF